MALCNQVTRVNSSSVPWRRNPEDVFAVLLASARPLFAWNGRSVIGDCRTRLSQFGEGAKFHIAPHRGLLARYIAKTDPGPCPLGSADEASFLRNRKDTPQVAFASLLNLLLLLPLFLLRLLLLSPPQDPDLGLQAEGRRETAG